MMWIKTKLSDFCFKCIANNHDQCIGKCECLCKGLVVDQDEAKNRAYRDCNHTDYFAIRIDGKLCCNNCGNALSKKDITELKKIVKEWDK